MCVLYTSLNYCYLVHIYIPRMKWSVKGLCQGGKPGTGYVALPTLVGAWSLGLDSKAAYLFYDCLKRTLPFSISNIVRIREYIMYVFGFCIRVYRLWML